MVWRDDVTNILVQQPKENSVQRKKMKRSACLEVLRSRKWKWGPTVGFVLGGGATTSAMLYLSSTNPHNRRFSSSSLFGQRVFAQEADDKNDNEAARPFPKLSCFALTPTPSSPSPSPPSWLVETVTKEPGWEYIQFPTEQQRKAKGFVGKHFFRHEAKVKDFQLFHKEGQHLLGYVDFGYDCEGPPGCVHGGCIATLFDSAFGNLVSQMLSHEKKKTSCVTLNLDVNYRKFLPMGTRKRLEAEVQRKEGRKVFLTARIVDPATGEVHCESTALFLEIDPERWRQRHQQQQRKEEAKA